jgi:hypothetical protein
VIIDGPTTGSTTMAVVSDDEKYMNQNPIPSRCTGTTGIRQPATIFASCLSHFHVANHRFCTTLNSAFEFAPVSPECAIHAGVISRNGTDDRKSQQVT